ncbi:MAG TPA: carbon storage regulator CsrA [Atribacteraceae bacterium]|nr:carbon storage regulator CsrA [Atribacteraceae bacterium]
MGHILLGGRVGTRKIRMLVISRKTDQAIRIGDTIQIQVVGIGKGKVRLGIVAPSDIPVYREELYQDLVAGNKTSLVTSPEMIESVKKAFTARLSR